MKKLSKITLYFLMIILIAVFLSGCESKKLVGTKTNKDETVGEYEEIIEVTFKNKVADEVTVIYKFETEEDANNVFNLYKLFIHEEMHLNSEEKSVTVKTNADSYFKKEKNLGKSRKEIKSYLEGQGYNTK